MANLKNVIYLSNEDYETLVSTGTVTIDGTTLTYDADNVYITPEKVATTTEDGLMSATDKTKLDGLDDSNLVHKSGSETITGQKTFTEDLWFKQPGWSDAGYQLETTSWGSLRFQDRSGSAILAMYRSGSNRSVSAGVDDVVNLGANGRWKNFHMSGLVNPNSSGYGLSWPDTTNFTASKTVATTSDLPQIEDWR